MKTDYSGEVKAAFVVLFLFSCVSAYVCGCVCREFFLAKQIVFLVYILS